MAADAWAEAHPTRATPLRVGIAGLGRLGRRHAETLALYTVGCTLVAACSPVQAELDSLRGPGFHPGYTAWADVHPGDTARSPGETRETPRPYTDFHHFIADPDIDAVVLATPTPMHADQAIAALKAGKHVFVEKPLALNVEDCERVAAVAAEHPDQIIMVGFVRRFDASYQNAQRAIVQGEIGRPFLVRSQTCDLNDPSGAFMRFAPTSGGIFMDCSVHDIDVARWLLGNPRAVRAFATGTIAIHDGLREWGDVDNGLAIVEFDGGARAVFYASRTFVHGHEAQTEIIGTAGKLLVGHGAARDRVVVSDAHGVRHHAVADFHERFRDAFAQEMQAFVASCRGEQPLSLTLADATEATRIGLAITRSLHSGQPEAV